jgi:universal stress protein A
MYPFRRILIPTDFSTASEWVFDDAVRLAGATGAEILILHIRMTWESHPSELRLPADPSLYEYAEQQELERLRQRIRRANMNVSTRLVVKQAPHPGKEIVRTAQEENVDLIVIATHARHHVAHLLIGSTTLSVISNPPSPVMSMRYGIKKRTELRRLVVPVHLKQSSQSALDMARAIAEREKATLHLVTVCGEDERPLAQNLLDGLMNSLSPTFTVKAELLRGADIVREILKYVQKHDADLLVLNAEMGLKQTKSEIVRHSPVPVLVVPAV